MPNELSTADRIKKLAEAGFSQDRIATECRLTQPTICNYINGHHKLAREDVAKRVKQAYDRLMLTKRAAA